MTKILFSISELTRVSRQRSDDAILQEQKNDDEQIDVRSIFLALLHVVAVYGLQRNFSNADYQVLTSTGSNNCNYIIHSPNCLGQETAKRPFDVQVKLPPVHHTR